MSNMNQCNFVGRLAADPKFEPKRGEESARLVFRLVINRIKSDKADYINVTCWGPLAEAGSKYLEKGRECAVTGSLRTNSIKNEDGSYNNYWNISAQTVSYGAFSLKSQQEKVPGSASNDDLDAIANKLLKPKVTLGALVDKLVAKGMSAEEAMETASTYMDEKEAVSEDSPKEDSQEKGSQEEGEPIMELEDVPF